MPNDDFNNGNIYCYGHTHIYDIYNYHNITICNPGSASLPCANRKPTDMLLDEKTIRIDDLNDQIMKEKT